MQHFDVIIIGGGLGGLSAGAFLSRSGKKVLLLEKHYIPGGCATTFKRKDFVMEAGLHAMDGHLVNQENQRSLFKSLGIKSQLDFVEVPEFFHLEGKDLDFTFPTGMDKSLEALIKAFPEEEKGIRIFMKTLNHVSREISSLPRTLGKKILKYSLFPFFYPYLTRTFTKTVGRFLDKHIKNESLKLILQANILYYHDDPYGMSMLFFAKAQSSFIQYGGYFVKGGSQKLSDALFDVIRKNGGKVLLAKIATEILVEKGKAVGVKYRDTFNASLPPESYYASHIIHSGAVPLVKNLLPPDEAAKIASKIDHMEAATSLLTVYLGFDTDISKMTGGHYSTIFFNEELDHLSKVKDNLHGDWGKRSYVFVNYGLIDSGLAPEGKSVGVICTADLLSDYTHMEEEAYKARKEEIAHTLISSLEGHYPGISKHIEAYDVGTARTIKRYTLNPFGAPYGYAQTLKQVGWRRPAYKSPVDGLWLAGTWTFPGGGFTGAMLSGFLCGYKLKNVLDREDPDISPQEDLVDARQVKLLAKKDPADNTLELVFPKPEGFTFTPGQFAFLSLDKPTYTELDTKARALSLASHPSEAHLRFIMRKGSSSYKRSCEALKVGDSVTIFGPKGEFVLGNRERPKVFLCSGIGITPVLSMLKELEQSAFRLPVLLFNSNRTPEQAVEEPWLREVKLEQYRYLPVYSGKEGRLDANTIRGEIQGIGEADFYLVGTSSFLKNMKEILHRLDVPNKSIYMDDFG